MILLIDDLFDDKKDKRIRELKDSLNLSGLPCVVIKSESASRFPLAFAAFVFTPSDDYLRTVSVRCKRIPLLAVNESRSRIYNNDALFYDPSTHVSYESFIFGFIKERYNVTPGQYSIGGLKISGREVSYGISRLKLTPAEMRILTLLVLCRNNRISEEIIGSFCFDGSSRSCRIPVHICNLNKKFRTVTGRRVIQTKRGLGYMIAETDL